MKQHTYIAIDLKSFYASVECRERGLDPLDTNLVVADESRTDKTICLAVTPSLKSYGISGRGRLFEVKQRVKESNVGRQHDAPGHRLDGTSHSNENEDIIILCKHGAIFNGTYSNNVWFCMDGYIHDMYKGNPIYSSMSSIPSSWEPIAWMPRPKFEE